MKNLKSIRAWLHGLGAALIGGGASMLSSWLSMSAAKAIGIDIPEINFKAWGIIFLNGGIINAVLYLKQSPLPKLEDENEDGTGNPS